MICGFKLHTKERNSHLVAAMETKAIYIGAELRDTQDLHISVDFLGGNYKNTVEENTSFRIHKNNSSAVALLIKENVPSTLY